MKIRISITAIAFISLFALSNSVNAQALPKATISVVKDNGKVKVHTLVAPGDMFANTSHIIELPTQLIIVDGQFFAQYAQELKTYADGLGKPVTRFYISHDHPDHFIGFGDAFPDVKVYALKETKESIEKSEQNTLKERQVKMGPMIASKLNLPKFEVKPGKEVIDGITFIFEQSSHNEAENSLVIKLPQLGVYIAQDIVYNNVHLFITGNTDGWKVALNKIKTEKGYTTILGGHGKPTDNSIIDKDLAYLGKVDEILKAAKTPDEYKTKLLAAFPEYSAPMLIDIYSPILFKINQK